ncbi:MAG: RNA ligase partner protein [Candidatus Omnitrophota bacterium]
MKKPVNVIIDTSIFVNPASGIFFGQTPENALNNFLQKLKEKKDIFCHMPPSVYEELMKFIEKKPAAKDLLLINKKPPASYETPVPSLFLYEFIEEFRARVNKGLRIAEKYARNELKIKPQGLRPDEEMIKRLREEYRVALREGIIDSKEDFDLLLLAKELDAYLATSDNGLVKWAQKLGIPCIGAEELKELLEQ